MRTLLVIPVYNEAATIGRVVRAARRHIEDVLIVDDGSTDGTAEITARLVGDASVRVLRHEPNRGYGAALTAAFAEAERLGFDWAITMDCDEQHEPASIPRFLEAIGAGDADIVSGSRYLDDDLVPVGAPPADRRRINGLLTAEINDRIGGCLGCTLTDAFCGFKAHRVSAMTPLALDEAGYAFPMQLWVRAAVQRLRVRELPVRLIYNDPNRTFGSGLDDHDKRLAHYRGVLHMELCAAADRLPAHSTESICEPCGAS